MEQDLEAKFYQQGYTKDSGKIFKGGREKVIYISKLKELLDEIEIRAEKGNKIRCSDDPKHLLIGVIDLTDDQRFFIKLSDLKRHRHTGMSAEQIAFVNECLSMLDMKAGKDRLFKRN